MPRDKRLFARLDLDYADHPKIACLSDSAFRAHIEMILYARKYQTDGVIPKRFASRFATESLSELLANDAESPSLLSRPDGTYELHGYADMNETKAEIERRSRANTENGRRGGIAKARTTKRVAKQVATSSLSEKGSEFVAETETETDTPPKGGGARKRGTRIPEPFMLTHDMKQWAADEVPGVNVEASTRRFVDYWRAESGAKATKRDWVATWRNWLRRDADSRKPNKLTPMERAAQTAAAGRQVAGRQITSLELEQ